MKPGLYSTPPEVIRERKPQYKKSFKADRLIYLRDLITTPGTAFNNILVELGHIKLTRPSYPTAMGKERIIKMKRATKAGSFLQEVKGLTITRMQKQLHREKVSVQYKASFKAWEMNQTPNDPI